VTNAALYHGKCTMAGLITRVNTIATTALLMAPAAAEKRWTQALDRNTPSQTMSDRMKTGPTDRRERFMGAEGFEPRARDHATTSSHNRLHANVCGEVCADAS
jgi:hypothetical protein